MPPPVVAMLDYGAGNVRSVINAVRECGYEVALISDPADIERADRLIFPGVGSFGSAMQRLRDGGFVEPLRRYIAADKPFLGVCLGLQTLFEASEESPGVEGLCVIPGIVRRFDSSSLAVPHIGWNGVRLLKASAVLDVSSNVEERFYYVHSYHAVADARNADWILALTDYGSPFVAAVQKGNVVAAQFHPEKSAAAGLAFIRRFLHTTAGSFAPSGASIPRGIQCTSLAKRVIACLDVRTNENGDLVVTKGDQYDVKEKDGRVRNLGKPVDLATRYYLEGADEVTFLNITSFKNSPLQDQPMLEVLRQTSAKVFVPLTIGGGIRDVVDPDGTVHPALEVAGTYFRSGADKVSIGSDAVEAALELQRRGGVPDGSTGIEQIAHVYGSQAVVISIDPRRVYVNSPSDVPHHTFKTSYPGPNGEAYCWYQCTVQGGRACRDIGAYEVARACERLGAGEILLNCMDKDGTNSGFDIELVRDVSDAVRIPVIASSGAGCAAHFVDVFNGTGACAALAAGIFHRREVPICAVKVAIAAAGIPVRPFVADAPVL